MNTFKYMLRLSAFILLSADLQCSWENLDKIDPQLRASAIKEIHADSLIVKQVQQMAKNVTELFENYNVQYWAAFGTNLGALRQKGADGKQPGGMIPWDDDVDLCIHERDQGTIRDRPFRAELLKLNYQVVFHELVGLQIQSKTGYMNKKTQEIVFPFIDVFMVKLNADGTRYELTPEKVKNQWPKAWYKKDELDQMEKIPFGKFSLFIPSYSEDYLARQYGADWKTHGYYYFSHHSVVEGKKKWTLTGTDLDQAQFTGALKDMVPKKVLAATLIAQEKETFAGHNKAYWDTFYAKENLAREPSSLCSYVISKGFLAPGSTLLDLACGNGRDTFEFRKHGIEAFGLELSSKAVGSNLAHARTLGIQNEIFRVEDVCNSQVMKEFTDYDAIYARFFVHAITQVQQAGFMGYLASLNSGTTVILEFRTDKDPMYKMSTDMGENVGKTDHYRRYIPFAPFCEDLKKLGFAIKLAKEKNGLSVTFKDDPKLGRVKDDPMLARIVAVKN